MTNQEHFNRSVAVLVKAFFDGRLECTDCAACACGNLVAAANGYKVVPHDWLLPSGELGPDAEWFDCNRAQEGWPSDMAEVTEEGLRQIASTGYTTAQFTQIEAGFMMLKHHQAIEIAAEAYGEVKENWFRLMNVVDVLADIHGIDLTTATAAKALFVKPAAALAAV